MKITKRQLRRLIKEVSLSPNRTHQKAQDLEDLLNGWLYDKVELEYLEGTTYLIKDVETSSISEVKEEIREFGARFEYELGSGITRDIGVSFEG